MPQSSRDIAKRQLNPFRYGKPVPPQHFVGRENAVRTIFSRVYNGESTAIVGSPHIGKSSMLRYLADDQIKREWLAEIVDDLVFVDIDCHLLPSSYEPGQFWHYVLSRIDAIFANAVLHRQIEAAQQDSFSSFALQTLFTQLGRNEQRAVLFIDEFDSLLDHPNFNTAEFFGALRSLSTRTDGLNLVTASRLTVAEMNRRSQINNPLGSPFFNTFTEIRLPPLTIAEVDLLLDRVLEGTGVTISSDERGFIRRVAGRHPFLVQAAAATLFDAIIQGLTDNAKYAVAYQTLCQRTAAHFDDTWRHLTEEEQAALLILALAEMKGYAHQEDFNIAELGQLEWYDPQLRHLEGNGLVELVGVSSDQQSWTTDWRHMAVWREEHWRLSSATFVWWVFDNVIAGTHQSFDFHQWLQNQTQNGILTDNGKAKLHSLSGQVPQGLSTANFMEMLGAPQKPASVNTIAEDDHPMVAQRPLTILFLAANPNDTTKLLLDQEMRAVDEALQKSEFRKRFEIRSHWAVRYSDLQELLLRYQPQIVHFSGHGSEAGEVILQDVDGRAKVLSINALASLFAILKDNVQCVVLNACYSEQQAQAIAEHIDCVVGMSRAITDAAAIDFATAFYLGLGYGRNIKTAFDLGCNRIDLSGLSEKDIPKLLALRTDPHQVLLVNVDDLQSEDALSTKAASAPIPNKLTGAQFQQFQDALLSAFDEAGLRQMTRIELNENLNTIAGGGSLAEVVFNLLSWAERTGNLGSLLQGAINANPHNPALQAVKSGVVQQS